MRSCFWGPAGSLGHEEGVGKEVTATATGPRVSRPHQTSVALTLTPGLCRFCVPVFAQAALKVGLIKTEANSNSYVPHEGIMETNSSPAWRVPRTSTVFRKLTKECKTMVFIFSIYTHLYFGYFL